MSARRTKSLDGMKLTTFQDDGIPTAEEQFLPMLSNRRVKNRTTHARAPSGKFEDRRIRNRNQDSHRAEAAAFSRLMTRVHAW